MTSLGPRFIPDNYMDPLGEVNGCYGLGLGFRGLVTPGL